MNSSEFFVGLAQEMSILAGKSRNQIFQKAVDVVMHKHVRHSVFWLIVFSLLVYINKEASQSLIFIITNSLIYLAFFMVMVYFNIYYLIPKYLEQKKLGLYIFLLIVTAAIITPIRIMALYIKLTGSANIRQELPEFIPSTFFSFILIGIASTVVKISSDWLKHQRERKELETQNMQSELRFLKSQVNPHFLFNTLNSLYALTLKKSDKAPEIVIKLSEMMRYMLYECNERYVPLYKEINYLKNYLELEKLRQGDGVDIQFRMEGVVTDQRIAPMMFIPFVENSFKHGVNKQLFQSFVHICLKVNNGNIHIVIENSKPDTTPNDSPVRSGGIGLKNVKRRLNLIYPERYTLKIDDSPNAYRVELSIDLN
jgi:LytS/YehU family sensor histidine kinase